MALSDLTSSGVLPTDWASTVLPPAIRAEVAVVVEAALSTDSGVSPKVVVKTLALFQIDHIGLAVVMVYAKKLVVAGAYVSVLLLDSVFQREALDKLCGQRKWAIATNFVGNNTVLQVDLYHKMAAAGEYELANDLRDRFLG
ncbi:hypothetical protein DYB37_010661 [Aphanomyces astaci]|uniref:Uncharacterized protein n=1 Tax=Aphanomyces astaci TaxID=112090 RepID=A0A397DFZ3_APHAT|nr:hypothetical protein DYB30_009790 [Aphanomyces astaci]RHY92446.1 hypothetical protein DYB35_003500 [Aphanomyces astaci]RHZ05640.1 hypothetical protein DYB26_005563 [Aphanomyces astaci]RHZ11666.1 hypothetical protein DYB37_010661 [Aphanomyces astaci]RQM28114.1 hypothetical protein B5M09_010850 [Aphanomyces astaci]